MVFCFLGLKSQSIDPIYVNLVYVEGIAHVYIKVSFGRYNLDLYDVVGRKWTVCGRISREIYREDSTSNSKIRS